ncbi:MAG: hypothetical protein WAM60_00895 [Candidatus Promineifilaceae bacterium]
MNDKPSSSVPVWVWILGGCALLSVLFACIVVVIFLFGGLAFFTAVAPVSGPSVIPTPVVITAPPTPTQSQPEQPTTPTDTPPQTPTPLSNEPPATAEPGGNEETDADLLRQIEANVVELRGLEQLDEVALTSLTPDQLRQQLEDDFMEDYSPDESRFDVLSLSAFDFLERDFDLYNFTIDLLTEQIAGYYDPDTDEFVVISNGESTFTALEQFTYAHEFVHALQDQHFQLDRLSDDTIESDPAYALRALAEGDATLAQTLYISEGYLTQEQLFEILGQTETFDTTVFDSAPPVLADELEFPYTGGLEFVQTLYAQGGYSAVDAAWENLPQSTEQILHPERYLSGDEPQIVSLQPLTDTLGTGWQRLDEEALGEFYLREYLIQQLDAATADTAATGWGGDRYAVYWNEEAQQIVMVMKLVWDSSADLEEFANAYPDYPANLFGTPALSQPDGSQCWQGEDVICFYNNGEQTMIVRAPNLETAAAVAAAQNGG